MLYKVSERLTDRLITKGVITQENKDIYIYGFQLSISFLLSTISIILIGLLIGRLSETALFLIIYILLRSYSGGYHANSYIACFAITIGVYFSVILLSELISVNTISYIILSIIGIVLLALLAPVRNIHKKISSKDGIKYKIISLCLYIIFIVLGMFLSTKDVKLGNTVFFALCADLINLFPNCLRRNTIKIKEEEKCLK